MSDGIDREGFVACCKKICYNITKALIALSVVMLSYPVR